MKIPDKIQIIGSEIKTVYEQLILDEVGSLAQFNSSFNEIRLKKICDNKELGEDILFENYIHEILHASLHKLGHIELAKDEVFIEGLSNIWVQIIKQLKK